MREELEHDDPLLITYGCVPHWLNLLGLDIFPESIIKHITDINKYFWNHHLPSARLKDTGNVKPQLPGDTRWKSQLGCIETFLKNRRFMVEITEKHLGQSEKGIRHYKKCSEPEPFLSGSWPSHPTASCCWCYWCSPEWRMPPLAQTFW